MHFMYLYIYGPARPYIYIYSPSLAGLGYAAGLGWARAGQGLGELGLAGWLAMLKGKREDVTAVGGCW